MDRNLAEISATEVVAYLKDSETGVRESNALQAVKERMIMSFKNDPKESSWEDAAILSIVATHDEFKLLASTFVKKLIRQFETDEETPDLKLIRTIARFLRWREQFSLLEAKLRVFVAVIRNEFIHQGEWASTDKLLAILYSLCELLDAMVDVRMMVWPTDEMFLSEWLEDDLNELSESEEGRIASLAAYAIEALRRVPRYRESWSELSRWMRMVLVPPRDTAGTLETLESQRFSELDHFSIQVVSWLKLVKASDEHWKKRDGVDQIVSALIDVSWQEGWYESLRHTIVFVKSGTFDLLKEAIPKLVTVRNNRSF